MPNPGLDPRTEEQVISMLIAGDKPVFIVEATGVSHSTVSRIKAKLPEDVLEKLKAVDIDTITNLIMTQIETGIEATINIAQQTLNKEWCDKQKANELSTLYGVITDKNIRLLEASENASLAKAATQFAATETGEFAN